MPRELIMNDSASVTNVVHDMDEGASCFRGGRAARLDFTSAILRPSEFPAGHTPAALPAATPGRPPLAATSQRPCPFLRAAISVALF